MSIICWLHLAGRSLYGEMIWFCNLSEQLSNKKYPLFLFWGFTLSLLAFKFSKSYSYKFAINLGQVKCFIFLRGNILCKLSNHEPVILNSLLDLVVSFWFSHFRFPNVTNIHRQLGCNESFMFKQNFLAKWIHFSGPKQYSPTLQFIWQPLKSYVKHKKKCFAKKIEQ